MTETQSLEEFFFENWNDVDKLNEKISKFCLYDCPSDLIKGFMYEIGLNGYNKNINKARNYYSRIPNNKYALYRLAYKYKYNIYESFDVEKYLKILEIDPKFKYALYELGKYEYNNDYCNKAEEYYLKALEVDPKYSNVLHQLNILYECPVLIK